MPAPAIGHLATFGSANVIEDPSMQTAPEHAGLSPADVRYASARGSVGEMPEKSLAPGHRSHQALIRPKQQIRIDIHQVEAFQREASVCCRDRNPIDLAMDSERVVFID